MEREKCVEDSGEIERKEKCVEGSDRVSGGKVCGRKVAG